MEDNIKVDVEVLSSSYPKLESEMKRLLQFGEGLNRNVNLAAINFNSENFKRASGILKKTQANLKDGAMQLSKLKAYFDKLQRCANEYLNTKW